MTSEDFEKTSNDLKTCVTCGATYSQGEVCSLDGGILTYVKPDPLIGTNFLGRYEILSLIGRGGMSVVYKARHTLMDRLVAIKLLVVSDVISLKRFQLEAKIASNLRHPNVVTIFDFGVSDSGQPYLVMDFLDGKTLALEISEGGAMAVGRAVPIFMQTCDALASAHKRELIHRDLKPSNIVLVKDELRDDVVKLVDFGIAKVLVAEEGDSKEVNVLTKTGEVFGSPLYMSPEQCQGKKLDVRSDIYSLGCVMYETLTGKPPFRGTDHLDTMHKRLNEKPRYFATIDPALLVVPEQLENIVFKCLERDLDKRYQDVTELWTNLELFQNGLRPSAQVVRTANKLPAQSAALNAQKGGPSSRSEQSKTRALLLAAITMLAMGAIVFLFATPKHSAAPEKAKKLTAEWEERKAKGELQFQRGDYMAASKEFKEAAQLAEDFDSDDPRLAATLDDLGNTYYKRDLYPEAEKSLKRALDIRKEAYGPDGLPVADSMTDLAGVYLAEGRTAECESLLNQAMDIRKRDSGPNSEDYAQSMKAMAALYNKTGREKEAMTLLIKALDIRKRKLAPDHPDIAETENSLAMEYQIVGELDKARQLYESARKIAEQSLGVNHPLVADSIVGLASVAFLNKQYAESEALFQKALKIRQKACGSESLRTGEVLSCLGVLKDSEGKYAEAAPFFKQSLSIKVLALGPDHPEVMRSVKLYADELRKLGRDKDADLVEARMQSTTQAQKNE